MEYIVDSDQAFAGMVRSLTAAFTRHRYLRVKVRAGGDRTLPQNALVYALYGKIAQALPEDTPAGWMCFCKLTIGVPILRAEDEDFRQVYDSVIRPRTYEEKLRMMEILPVTSRMTKDQLSQYVEGIQNAFRARGVAL